MTDDITVGIEIKEPIKGRSAFTISGGWDWFTEMQDEGRTRELEIYTFPHNHNDDQLIVFTPAELDKQREQWEREAWKACCKIVGACGCGDVDCPWEAADREKFEQWLKERK